MEMDSDEEWRAFSNTLNPRNNDTLGRLFFRMADEVDPPEEMAMDVKPGVGVVEFPRTVCDGLFTINWSADEKVIEIGFEKDIRVKWEDVKVLMMENEKLISVVIPFVGHEGYEINILFDVLSQIVMRHQFGPGSITIQLVSVTSSQMGWFNIKDISYKQFVHNPFDFEKLHHELQTQVLSYLCLNDVLNYRCVSKRYQAVVNKNAVIWQSLIAKHIKTSPIEDAETIPWIFWHYKYGSNYELLFKDIYEFVHKWPDFKKQTIWIEDVYQKFLCIRYLFYAYKLAESETSNYDFLQEYVGGEQEPANNELPGWLEWTFGKHHALQPCGSYSKYLLYGLLFLLFDQLQPTVRDGELILNGPCTRHFQYKAILNWYSSACTLITSSNVFGNDIESKKKLYTQLAYFTEILYRGGISSKTDLDLALVKVASLLDENLTSDRIKKLEFKEKAIKYLSTNTEDNPLDHPVTYYNTACIYSLFNEFEEAKKHFTWCFNWKDGEFKEHKMWTIRKLERLVIAARGDADLANVRNLPWFNQVLEEFAKVAENAKKEEEDDW
jgi:hypothetical protein